MTDKITSIADAMKAIKKLKVDANAYTIETVLKILRELEAGVREEDNLYKEALSTWGEEAQVKMAMEECAELIQVLVKYGRYINGSTVEQIQGEIADVQIMLNQLKIVFGEDRISEIKLQKLEKVRRVLEGEKG